MRASRSLVPVAAACLLALAACSKHADENANVPVGATGSGNTGTTQPGTGLNGGLGNGGATAMGAAPVASGSSNATTGSSFGNRP